MEIPFETLQRLPLIEKKLDQVLGLLENRECKRWLSSKEAAQYLGYSADGIRKLIKNGDLKSGVHFHQRHRKLIFDADSLDRWITGSDDKEVLL